MPTSAESPRHRPYLERIHHPLGQTVSSQLVNALQTHVSRTLTGKGNEEKRKEKRRVASLHQIVPQDGSPGWIEWKRSVPAAGVRRPTPWGWKLPWWCFLSKMDWVAIIIRGRREEEETSGCFCLSVLSFSASWIFFSRKSLEPGMAFIFPPLCCGGYVRACLTTACIPECTTKKVE
jgi:hypothetical protein